MIKDKEKHLKDIMLVFALTEEDLQANRRGDITPSQLQKMQRTQFMGCINGSRNVFSDRDGLLWHFAILMGR